MLTNYEVTIRNIDSLIDFLKSLCIEASVRSHLEHDYLMAHEFVENYRAGKHKKQTSEGRSALSGLHELYKWIWSIKDAPDFHLLLPHMGMLIESATRINAVTPMISPVTGKQDDKTNKLIETIVGMYSIKVGENIDLDDPLKSSNGTNPDVMFTYSGNRVAFACKTLRGKSEMTFLDNLRSAANQINRAKCDFGYIAINAMNIIPHEKIENRVFTDFEEPLKIITSDIINTYTSTRENNCIEMHEIFEQGKIRPVILTFIHSTTRLTSPVGNLSTILKGTFATDMCIGKADISKDILFLSGVNEFIHNRL